MVNGTKDDLKMAIYKALDIAYSYGNINGMHHKQWIIDQMVRALTGEYYDEWVIEVKAGEDGPDTYEWDIGIVSCGDAWCEVCGDCLACYGDDPCTDGNEHTWPRKEVDFTS